MSRSMITGNLEGGGKRTVWTPNTSLGGAVNVSKPSVGTAFNFTTSEFATFNTVEQNYTYPMSNRRYENIPTGFTDYLILYQTLVSTQYTNRKNTSLNLLIQIAIDALTGAINSYGLNALNVELDVQNTYLQNTIEELLSQQNVQPAYSDTTGTLDMTKTLVLAPLFAYYINIYGIPEPGVGFDPNRLSVVLTALQNSGIDPYN